MPRHGWAASELREAALTYAIKQQWAVAQGHFQDRYGCSCGNSRCATPGAHPVRPYWSAGATEDPHTIRSSWSRDPYTIILPTGRQFDVLDVPGGPGGEALMRLEILGYRLGPVARTTDGRILIWVASGSRLYSLGVLQRYGDAGIRCLSAGDYVLAPPSAGARWLASPGATSWHLPSAADLIGTIACACGQAKPETGGPTALPPQRTGNQFEERAG